MELGRKLCKWHFLLHAESRKAPDELPTSTGWHGVPGTPLNVGIGFGGAPYQLENISCVLCPG